MDSTDPKAAIIHGFRFCLEHGNEFCNACEVDHRRENNWNWNMVERLEDKFPGRETTDYQVCSPVFALRLFCPMPAASQERIPITNAFKYGAVWTVDELWLPFDFDYHCMYECTKHRVTDCAECFDWVNIVLAMMQRLYDSDDPVFIDLAMKRRLGLLASMGIELSPVTKRPDKEINSMLGHAIRAAEALEGDAQLDVTSLPRWWQAGWQSGGRTGILNSFSTRRDDDLLRPTLPPSTSWAAYSNTFGNVMQGMRNIAEQYDEGHRNFVLQDGNEERAVFIRVS